MAKTTKMVEVAVSDLVPYRKNAKIHGEEQVKKLKKRWETETGYKAERIDA